MSLKRPSRTPAITRKQSDPGARIDISIKSGRRTRQSEYGRCWEPVRFPSGQSHFHRGRERCLASPVPVCRKRLHSFTSGLFRCWRLIVPRSWTNIKQCRNEWEECCCCCACVSCFLTELAARFFFSSCNLMNDCRCWLTWCIPQGLTANGVRTAVDVCFYTLFSRWTHSCFRGPVVENSQPAFYPQSYGWRSVLTVVRGLWPVLENHTTPSPRCDLRYL